MKRILVLAISTLSAVVTFGLFCWLVISLGSGRLGFNFEAPGIVIGADVEKKECLNR